MLDHLDNFGPPTCSYLSIDSLNQIQATADKFPSPAFITETVLPEVVAGKWRKWLRSISDETPSGVSIHGKQKYHKQMVRIPERFV